MRKPRCSRCHQRIVYSTRLGRWLHTDMVHRLLPNNQPHRAAAD